MTTPGRPPVNRPEPRRKPRVAGVSAGKRTTSVVQKASATPVTAKLTSPTTSAVERKSYLPGWVRRPGKKLIVVGAALVAALLIAGLVSLYFKGAESKQKNRAFIDKAATAEAKVQIGQKICLLYTVENSDFKKWKTRIEQNYTGEALKVLGPLTVPPAIDPTETGTVAKMNVACQVEALGIGYLDDTRAVALVNLIFSKTDLTAGENSGTWGTRLEAQKVAGQWKISRILTAADKSDF